MTRVTTAENEGYLLMIARQGTAYHVETLVRKAIERALDHANQDAAEVSAETSPLPAAPETASIVLRRADALVDLAESYLARGPASSADRYQVMLHVAAETLTQDADDTCYLEDGGRGGVDELVEDD